LSTSNSPIDDKFVFNKNDNIGSAGAEDDEQYLSECFVDNGDIAVLSNCKDPKSIIVGRTGAGKTALLSELEKTGHRIILLSPHSLALNYISNNNVIRFFEEVGLNLLPFYSLLWKHILVVELLKDKFGICSNETQKQGMIRLREMVGNDNIKEQAIDYLEKWGSKFWLTTEQRMQELTSKVEKSLSGTLDVSAGPLTMTGKGAQSLSAEEKAKVIERGRQAVNAVQIRELENLISILNEVLHSNKQQQYYVLIDSLDETWAEDALRFRLIKALIDSIKRFRKVEPLKIILAMRQDLLSKVLHSSPDAGFQEEKYESLYLYVTWNQQQLKDLVNRRLNLLVRRRYTNSELEFDDLFPQSVDQKNTFLYMIERTMLRPRDIIFFVNECIEISDGRDKLTADVVKHAEENYSQKRLTSLFHEWQLAFPHLKYYISFIHNFKANFQLNQLTEEHILARFEESSNEIYNMDSDPVTQRVNRLYAGEGNFNSIRAYIVQVFYDVGVVGIKLGSTSSVKWSHNSNFRISTSQISSGSVLHIHPMYYRALNIHFK
jgi:hypothetical protein